jgi:hypothetical protein
MGGAHPHRREARPHRPPGALAPRHRTPRGRGEVVGHLLHAPGAMAPRAAHQRRGTPLPAILAWRQRRLPRGPDGRLGADPHDVRNPSRRQRLAKRRHDPVARVGDHGRGRDPRRRDARAYNAGDALHRLRPLHPEPDAARRERPARPDGPRFGRRRVRGSGSGCRAPDLLPLTGAPHPKASKIMWFRTNGAEGGSRTHTPSRVHDFESCASASSATSALTPSSRRQALTLDQETAPVNHRKRRQRERD